MEPKPEPASQVLPTLPRPLEVLCKASHLHKEAFFFFFLAPFLKGNQLGCLKVSEVKGLMDSVRVSFGSHFLLCSLVWADKYQVRNNFKGPLLVGRGLGRAIEEEGQLVVSIPKVGGALLGKFNF